MGLDSGSSTTCGYRRIGIGDRVDTSSGHRSSEARKQRPARGLNPRVRGSCRMVKRMGSWRLQRQAFDSEGRARILEESDADSRNHRRFQRACAAHGKGVKSETTLS